MFSNVYELFKHIFLAAPKRKSCRRDCARGAVQATGQTMTETRLIARCYVVRHHVFNL